MRARGRTKSKSKWDSAAKRFVDSVLHVSNLFLIYVHVFQQNQKSFELGDFIGDGQYVRLFQGRNFWKNKTKCTVELSFNTTKFLKNKRALRSLDDYNH